MRILLVADEVAIANFIAEGLQEEGFAVDTAHNGRDGLRLALDNLAEYDLVLLDWMMPGVSGIEICRAIRKENKELPVIFLAAKDTVDDVVFGLETGANDYLRKPFAFEELLARIRVLLRSSAGEQTVFRYRDIELDVATHQMRKAGRPVELTQKEFALLELLLRNTLWIVFPALLLALFLATSFAASKGIAPVQQLIQAASEIDEAHIHTRLPPPQTQDEIHQLAATFNELLQRLDNSIQREKQFTADASHEIRTPLTAIRGTLEVLIRKQGEPAQYEEKISRVISEVDRLHGMLDQLRQLARWGYCRL